jgi:hypothetical protein
MQSKLSNSQNYLAEDFLLYSEIKYLVFRFVLSKKHTNLL